MKIAFAAFRGRFALTGAGLAAVWLVGCTVPELKAPEVGSPAPAFTAVTLDGASVSSEDLTGAPYLLNIWATWCAPCREEMPELQQLHDAYSEQGFSVVGVSVDNRSDTEVIRSFLAELAIDFPVYHDPSWQIMDDYFLQGLPASFLIDGGGVLARKWTGPIHAMEESIQANVRALLAEDLGG